MTTFNTGNPLGSTDVYDRYDNSENLDNFSNGPLDAYPDRFGVSRQSMQGIRNASQYQVLGAYAAGLQFTAMNQVFSYLGEFYAPGQSIALPYTTTGAGAGEIANFRSVGDAVLRDDLSNDTDPAKGAGMVGFKQVGAGAVGRTLLDKACEVVSVKDFGAVGDGVTDDSNALGQFWLSAIANPGVPHRLEAKTYAISATLPIIDASNVCIIGEGAEIHDVGPLMTGTVIKWIGAPGTVGPLLKISSVPGVSNQRVSNVTFSGIGIDCHSGSLQYGIELSSVWSCDIDVAVSNASNTGLLLDVVASLGEAKDLQRCRIRYKGRQIEAPNGLSMVLGGDAVANVSMNEFWCDIQHSNGPAIYSANADNNDWFYVRTLGAGGTAVESVSLLGGPTALQSVRAERFHFLTCNLPLHAYGSPDFVVGSVNNKIYCLDTENGSPAPVIGTGASVLWQKDTTNLADNRWDPFTPTVSAVTGTITASTASGRFAKRGSVVHVAMSITITTNGTGAGALVVTLPLAPSSVQGAIIVGRERALTGRMLCGYATQGQTSVPVQFADGSYPGANGYVINIAGTYEV